VRFYDRLVRLDVASLLALSIVGACSSSDTTAPTPSVTITGTPCSVSGTLQLSVSQTARVDCSNGGTLVTVAGNGASYIVVPQLPVDLVADAFVSFRLTAGTSAAAATTDLIRGSAALGSGAGFEEFGRAPNVAQQDFDRWLRARSRANVASGAWRPSARSTISRSLVASAAPDIGSVRAFRVLSSEAPVSFKTVGAQLIYAGANVLFYMDTTVTPGAFTAAQIQAFGSLFDQTLYPIDTAAFGPPSDVDGNGHVIMLMSPVVNALTKKSDCLTNGFIGGFFDDEDLGGPALDPNSNHGEVFYSIAPDPNGLASCAHSAADVGFAVSAVFMHELQHLINFSQHVVVHGSDSEFGWLDEGLSIVAEELGSLYYENKCPGTACRTDPSQVFPDSSQGFIQDFLYDSYVYALRPDTASVTLHSDSDDGFSWRGGDWLLVRWLGDQFTNGVFRKLDQTGATGVANIEQATAQSFPTLFADFGLSLYTDSLPGLPRTTVPARDRLTTRNVRQLWARLFVTSGGSPDIPLPFPVVLKPITADSSTRAMVPGTSSYFRLDTPASAAAVTLKFSNITGGALSSGLKPQLAIFRLPSGQ
jgi:hypothetical protein